MLKCENYGTNLNIFSIKMNYVYDMFCLLKLKWKASIRNKGSSEAKGKLIRQNSIIRRRDFVVVCVTKGSTQFPWMKRAVHYTEALNHFKLKAFVESTMWSRVARNCSYFKQKINFQKYFTRARWDQLLLASHEDIFVSVTASPLKSEGLFIALMFVTESYVS